MGNLLSIQATTTLKTVGISAQPHSIVLWQQVFRQGEEPNGAKQCEISTNGWAWLWGVWTEFPMRRRHIGRPVWGPLTGSNFSSAGNLLFRSMLPEWAQIHTSAYRLVLLYTLEENSQHEIATEFLSSWAIECMDIACLTMLHQMKFYLP